MLHKRCPQCVLWNGNDFHLAFTIVHLRHAHYHFLPFYIVDQILTHILSEKKHACNDFRFQSVSISRTVFEIS